MKNIGILGGTFNPIHLAHLEIARQILEKKEFHKILIMPNKIPPHKDIENLVSDKDRYEMVRLSSLEYDKIEPSSFELELNTVSYTANTLDLLKKKYRNYNLYLIIGGDSLLSLDNWYKPEKILKNVNIIYVPRDTDLNIYRLYIDEVLRPKYNYFSIEEIRLPYMDISSSKIRSLLSCGNKEEARLYLNPLVYEYIEKNKLYMGACNNAE